MKERAITGGINPYLFCDTCGHPGETHVLGRCASPVAGNWRDGFTFCPCAGFVPERQGRAEGIFQVNTKGLLP